MQVLPSLVTGGAERGTVDVAAAIVAAGGRSIVVSSGGPMVREIEAAGAEHIRLSVDSKNPLVMARNAARLTRLIAACGVGLVHARSRAPAWSALAAARRVGVPFVTTFHGVYNAGSRAKRLYNSVMARGDSVIAVSRFVADHLRDVYGIAQARVRVIHRGIDLARFDRVGVGPDRVESLRRQWQIPPEARVVMLPGRLTRWKGQLLLLEALAALPDSDLRCVLVGSEQDRADYRRELVARAERLGLAGRVLLAGECDDMPAAYAMADVVVSASTDPEAFGRVMAEAQAMGVPVIAAGHGAAPEIVRDGETGWLFPPGDAQALSARLRGALSLGPDDRARISARATARGRAFSKERMCAETLAVYGDAIRARSTRPA